MDVHVFTEAQLPVALAAIAAVLAARGDLGPRARQYLAEVARFHAAAPPDSPAPVDLDVVAAAIDGAHARRRLVQFAAIAALVDGAPTLAAAQALAALDRALGVREPVVAVVAHLARGQRRRARIKTVRRVVGRFFRAALRAEGVGGVVKIVRPLLLRRGRPEPELAWRYRQLGLLPPGSFGREFWAHITARRFDLPGEGQGAIPERLVFHDVGHVLTGYDTDPAGEIQQGAFQAGFMRDDGFAFLAFVVLQFHLGLQITPVAAPEVGYFDVPKVMRALARGAACRVDLSSDWRIWDDAARPLVEVRAALGIPAP